jgi:hypothetical protein
MRDPWQGEGGLGRRERALSGYERGSQYRSRTADESTAGEINAHNWTLAEVMVTATIMHTACHAGNKTYDLLIVIKVFRSDSDELLPLDRCGRAGDSNQLGSEKGSG